MQRAALESCPFQIGRKAGASKGETYLPVHFDLARPTGQIGLTMSAAADSRIMNTQMEEDRHHSCIVAGRGGSGEPPCSGMDSAVAALSNACCIREVDRVSMDRLRKVRFLDIANIS